MNLKEMLFGFEGRIRRRDWWLWSIAASLAYAFALALVGVAFYSDQWGQVFMAPAVIGSPPAELAVTIALQAPMVWVQLALAAKRAHDRATSARVVIALSVISVLASFLPPGLDIAQGFEQAAPTDVALWALGAFNVVAGLYVLVVLGFLDGTPGPNRFGRSPKGIGGERADVAADVFS